jgi:hypothetical protein
MELNTTEWIPMALCYGEIHQRKLVEPIVLYGVSIVKRLNEISRSLNHTILIYV